MALTFEDEKGHCGSLCTPPAIILKLKNVHESTEYFDFVCCDMEGWLAMSTTLEKEKSLLPRSLQKK